MNTLSPPFGAKVPAMGLAWYRREDYQRIREISNDEMQPTFDAFEEKMQRWLPQLKTQLPPGIIIEKVIVNPDDLLAFAEKFHGGKIDTKVRSAFAAAAVMKKYGDTR
ncbi:MAG: hypothetical protein AB7O50_05890 [Pseudolabrys sp.]